MSTNQQLALEGANNLLFDAIGVNAGETLLIVGEKGADTHFDEEVCRTVHNAATTAGLTANILTFEVCNSANEFPALLDQAMLDADHTVFFSRLGDQVRFSSTPGTGSKTMCYALNSDYLASDFCRIPHSLLKELHDRLISRISHCEQFEITCKKGTQLRGKLQTQVQTDPANDTFTAFEVGLFPQTIFPPVSCASMSGQLVLKDWLTSSSTVIYEDSVLLLENPIVATIKNGMITGFDGDHDECLALENHFRRVSDIVGGEAMAINSWHTGIIPATWYSGRARDNLERWGSVSYASPRITHFHACGSDPGQIGINLFDASIHLDNEPVFDEGHYLFPLSHHCADLFESYSSWREAFKHNADIGELT